MSYEQRIRKLQAEGLLSERQAAALTASLTGSGSPPSDAGSKRRLGRSGLIILLLVVLVVTAIFIVLDNSGAAQVSGGEIAQVKDLLNKPEGTGAMNTTLSNMLSAFLIVLPLALVALLFAWFYNGLVSKEEKVYLEWAQVESNFQRRTDLIPGLLETVTRYMQHERETLSNIAAERSGAMAPLASAMERVIAEQAEAMGATDASQLEDQASLQQLSERQATLGASLRNLIAVSEDYPELRSADQFLALQAQLEGTENRINISRMNFNVAVEQFNGAIRRLPGSLIASLGNFQRKAYFQTDPGQDRPVPVVFEQE